MMHEKVDREVKAASRAAVPPDRRYRTWVAVLGIGLAVRLLIGLLTEPYSDETYYRAWAEHLDFGYFDHPPLIAVVLAIFRFPRLASLTLGGLTLLALAGLARALHGDPAAGWRAVALGATLPAAVLGGTFATVDLPLQLFWVLALWALVARRDGWAGVALGLALLSKYTGVLLLGTAVLALSFRREWRRAATVGVLALLLFSPVLAWNVAHGGESFLFQLRHGLEGRTRGAVLEYLGGQWAMAGPLFFPLAMVLLARARVPSLLKASVALPFVFFLLAAFRTRQEVNWPAMAYLGACAALAGVETRARRVAAWANAALCVAATIHLVLLPFPLRKDHVLHKLHGWTVLRALKQTGASVVFAPSYRLASEAWWLTRLPTAVAGSTRRSQYDLWPSPAPAVHGDAVWLAEQEPVPAQLAARFASVDPPATLQSHFRGRLLHTFKYFVLRDYLERPKRLPETQGAAPDLGAAATPRCSVDEAILFDGCVAPRSGAGPEATP